MSLIKSSTASMHSCKCQHNAPVGKMSLRIVPKALDVRQKAPHDEQDQLQHAERLQNLFFPTMHTVSAHAHGDGIHMHPAQHVKVAHISQLHDELDKKGLAARLNISPGGDSNTIALAISRQHVSELMRNKFVDLNVPFKNATVRLHSTKVGRITDMEYCEN